MKRVAVLFTLLFVALAFAATTSALPLWQERPEPVDACHAKCESKYRCNQRCRKKENHEHCMEMCNHYKERCKARCDKKTGKE